MIVASTTGVPVAKPGFPTPPWPRWAMPTSAERLRPALQEAFNDRVGEGELRSSDPAFNDRVGEGELRSPEPERVRPSAASGGQGGGQGPQVWEPSQGSHHDRAVALMVEQRSPKPRVVGSSPACPARSRRRGLSQGSYDRVGGGEIHSSRPERARPSAASGGEGGGQEPRVWEPSHGSHYKGA